MAPYNLDDVTRGLGNLRRSLEDDLLPVLQATMGRERGGFFIVPREVFAYIDFLGAVYAGYGGEADRAGRRAIATPRKAKRFLAGVLGEVEPVYARYGPVAYDMFRHGTIHVYRPHALKRADGATIEWLAYKGERSNAPCRYERRVLSVSHLQPQEIDAAMQRWIMPLSINLLYEDLQRGIDVYEERMRTEVQAGDLTLLNHYSSAMEALMQPEATDLDWRQ